MKNQNNIKCPECGLNTCVFGKIDNRDSEVTDNVHFVPSNIIQKSFWKFINRDVDLTKNGNITACYSCGYMWGHLNSDKLKNVLSKLGWEGEPQIERKTINLPIIAERVAIAIVISLVLFIFFLYFKT